MKKSIIRKPATDRAVRKAIQTALGAVYEKLKPMFDDHGATPDMEISLATKIVLEAVTAADVVLQKAQSKQFYISEPRGWDIVASALWYMTFEGGNPAEAEERIGAPCRGSIPFTAFASASILSADVDRLSCTLSVCKNESPWIDNAAAVLKIMTKPEDYES